MPFNIKELSKISGVEPSVIRNFFKDDIKTIKRFLRKKPWRNSDSITIWTDITGAKIPDKAFLSVAPFVGKTGSLKFVVELKDHSIRVFKYSYKELKKMYNKKGTL